MTKLLNNIINFVKYCFLVSKTYLLIVFAQWIKLQIKLLYFVIQNLFVYFIYIVLVMYYIFGPRGSEQNTLSYAIILFLVIYLMGTSLQLYIIFKVPKLKNFFILMLGQQFIETYLPIDFKGVLACFTPVFYLTLCEITTEHIFYQWQLYEVDACYKTYQELYGLEPPQWDENIQIQYLKERANITSLNHGLMTYLAHKIHF